MEILVIALALAAVAAFVYTRIKRSNERTGEGGMGGRPEPREDTDFK